MAERPDLTPAALDPPSNLDATQETGEVGDGEASRSGKRRFFGLGKKKGDAKLKAQDSATGDSVTSSTISTQSTLPEPQATSGLGATSAPALAKTNHPYLPSSPIRDLRSSSPAPNSPSPASSQIFERHVQEDSLAIREQAPIPGHITTENLIPPVLDASSEAITNEELNPDKVEIVMHAGHQPAALTVTGPSSSSETGTGIGAASWTEELLPPDQDDVPPAIETGHVPSVADAATTDVRRLSFISFADVVNAEHAHDTTSGTSITPGMISPVTSSQANRSPSPIRSPLSSQALGSGSPTMSGSISSRGWETSPNRGASTGRTLASPMPGHSPPTSGGELTVETMRQALRKTGSGDLTGVLSAPLSATGDDEVDTHQAFK